ncbi:hypothetical protein EI94DRAFT_1739344 [Lactarius quietus]|nr:hypothetical protein EI94DRAFT_1739344 [Lactarius quietus]
MGVDPPVDTVDQGVASSAFNDNPVPGVLPEVLHDQYCFMCGNGGDLVMCDNARCSRAICIGPEAQCLALPINSRFEDPDVVFICPPCHQDKDRRERKPSPYYGFYHDVVPGTPSIEDQDMTLTRTVPTGPISGLDIQTLEPLYDAPAEVRGSAQLIPRSKFLGGGVAILNFRLDAFHLDTGDLGNILKPFANAFFSEDGDILPIYQEILFDMSKNQHEHQQRIRSAVRELTAARSTLKTVVVLITTHAEDGTGCLATSSSHHVSIDEWMDQVVTRPLLDIIGVLDAQWFFFCCGALVKTPPSLRRVESFANKWKPVNLFAFDAPSFHPIYATTFLLNFFQHIIVEGRTFDSAAGQLLNTSPLCRHTGILRFWTFDSVVRKCVLRWAHSRTQPWGMPVPYQCPSCHCIQAWDQKNGEASSQLGRDVSMHCSYKGNQGLGQGRCRECLTLSKPSEPFKPVKLSEGVWVAFGLEKSEFL